MAEVGSASIAIVPTFRGFNSKIAGEAENAGKESGGKFSGAFKGLVGPALAAVGVGAFSGLIAEAARASDATDKFKSTLNFAGLDTSAIKAAADAAKSYADQTVYDLPTIQQTMAQLASNGVKDYTSITKAAGNLNAVAGGNAETFKSVSRTLTQSAGAGKLMTEDWNMLADAIPGASGPLQKSLKDAGAYTGNFRDAMAAGQITAEEFQTAITQLGNDPVAVEAAKSTKTFEGAIGNLRATINSGLMSALDKMKPAITGVINLLANGLGKSFEWIGSAFTGLVDLFGKGDFTSALGKAFNVSEDSGFVNFLFNVRDVALEVGGGFRAMFAAFKAGDGDITSSGFAGFMERVGGLARQLFDAVGPLVAQMVSLWSSVSPVQVIFAAIQPLLPQLVDMFGQLASTLGGALGAVLTGILPMIMQLSALISQSLGQVLAAVLPTIVQMITMLGKTFSDLLPIIMPIIATLVQLAMTLIQQLAPIITDLVTSLMPPLISIFGNILGAIGPLITTLAGVLIPVIQALLPVVVTVFSVVASVITAAMQIVQGIIQVVTGIISGNWSQVWDGIGNIFAGIWNTIVAVVSGAIKYVSTVIGAYINIASGIVNSVLGNIGRFFSDTWNNVIGGVGGFVGDLVGFFRDLPGRIMSTLGNLGTLLLDSGRALMQGFIDGIKGMVGAIGDAVGGVLDFAKQFFPHSPAKRGPFSGKGYTSFSGQALARDFAGGIDSQQSLVARSAAGLMSSAALNINGSDDPGLGLSGSSTAGRFGNTYNTTINQVDDPLGTSYAVTRRLAALGV